MAASHSLLSFGFTKDKATVTTPNLSESRIEIISNSLTSDIPASNISEDIHTNIFEEGEPPRVKRRRHYNPSITQQWLKLYTWLYVENELLKCRLCIETSQKNSFVDGSRNYQLSALSRHQNSDHHKAAINQKVREKYAAKCWQTVQAHKDVQDEQSQTNLAVMARTVHWLASEEVAPVKFNSLIQLQVILEVFVYL